MKIKQIYYQKLNSWKNFEKLTTFYNTKYKQSSH